MQQICGRLGSSAKIREGKETLLDVNIHFWNIIYRLMDVFSGKCKKKKKNTHKSHQYVLSYSQHNKM